MVKSGGGDALETHSGGVKTSFENNVESVYVCVDRCGTVKEVMKHVGVTEEVGFANFVPEFPGVMPSLDRVGSWLPCFPDAKTYTSSGSVCIEETEIMHVDQDKKVVEASLLKSEKCLASNGFHVHVSKSGVNGRRDQASNPFLVSPLEYGEKVVSLASIPETRVGLKSNDVEIVVEKRPVVKLKLKTGKKFLATGIKAGDLSFSLQLTGFYYLQKWLSDMLHLHSVRKREGQGCRLCNGTFDDGFLYAYTLVVLQVLYGTSLYHLSNKASRDNDLVEGVELVGLKHLNNMNINQYMVVADAPLETFEVPDDIYCNHVPFCFKYDKEISSDECSENIDIEEPMDSKVIEDAWLRNHVTGTRLHDIIDWTVHFCKPAMMKHERNEWACFNAHKRTQVGYGGISFEDWVKVKFGDVQLNKQIEVQCRNEWAKVKFSYMENLISNPKIDPAFWGSASTSSDNKSGHDSSTH
ncbi:hypothetical protein CTI12_AA271220 [Artemisia annua]|uniref:Uncharacterized protein n=1 Tax=Artemisia annua TaxID=35608 RepID=A0A2U1NFG8_ARTAN|nr:hypothetical protein CTI12_AA271220 [Artemisia annua]